MAIFSVPPPIYQFVHVVHHRYIFSLLYVDAVGMLVVEGRVVALRSFAFDGSIAVGVEWVVMVVWWFEPLFY